MVDAARIEKRNNNSAQLLWLWLWDRNLSRNRTIKNQINKKYNKKGCFHPPRCKLLPIVLARLCVIRFELIITRTTLCTKKRIKFFEKKAPNNWSTVIKRRKKQIEGKKQKFQRRNNSQVSWNERYAYKRNVEKWNFKMSGGMPYTYAWARMCA